MFGFKNMGGLGNVLGTVGATLQDINSGGETQSLARWRAGRAAQQEEAEKKAQLGALMQTLSPYLSGQTGGSIPSGVLAQAALINPALASTLTAVRGQDMPDINVDATSGQAYNQKDPSQAGRRFDRTQYINNFKVDPFASNAPDYIPELPKGTMPDGQGGVMNLPRLPQAMGEQTQAETLGRTFGTVFNRHNGDGTTTPTLGGSMFMPGGVGPGRTQSRPDAIRAETAATGEAQRSQDVLARAATAGRQLDALDTMESLLPDVVAGFGAEPRLQAERAMAALGNEDSVRKVKATETFLNQGRVLVADIIKTFGANPTEGERKYAERMSGADAALNPETLREGIRLQRARINRDLQAAGRAQPGAQSRAPARGPGVRTQGQGFRIISVE